MTNFDKLYLKALRAVVKERHASGRPHFRSGERGAAKIHARSAAEKAWSDELRVEIARKRKRP